ncbi:unnamed protein product [Caenorhabditis nigoni]
MRATVSLLNCCDVPPSHHPSMNGQMLFETCHFLPLPPAPTYRDALTSSCSDLIETVLALHSNTLASFPILLVGQILMTVGTGSSVFEGL